MEAINLEYEGYLITTDNALMYPDHIHKWLSEESYWSPKIPYPVVKKCFDNSFNIGIIKNNEQIGYARLITDYSSFAYLADVYVKEGHRGIGLSKVMMQTLMDIDWVKGCRNIFLATKDAQELYRKFGFTHHEHPERIMKISRPNIYSENSEAHK